MTSSSGADLAMDGNKKSTSFIIQRLVSASTLLDLAFSMGLKDIQQWVSTSDTEVLLRSGKWLAFGAFDGDDRVPCGVVSIGIEEEGRLWIELIAVSKHYRRKGIGTNLIQKVIDWGRNNNHRVLFVDVDDDNHPALEFYRSMGFTKAGHIDEYYYDASKALVFLRRL